MRRWITDASRSANPVAIAESYRHVHPEVRVEVTDMTDLPGAGEPMQKTTLSISGPAHLPAPQFVPVAGIKRLQPRRKLPPRRRIRNFRSRRPLREALPHPNAHQQNHQREFRHSHAYSDAPALIRSYSTTPHNKKLGRSDHLRIAHLTSRACVKTRPGQICLFTPLSEKFKGDSV